MLDGPWRRREVVWPSVRIAIGPIGILVAWYGSSDTLDWTEQSWWVAVASIALIVSLSGVAGWMKVGLRNVRHLERLMLGAARVQFAGAAVHIAADIANAQRHGRASLVTVAGTTLVHRADCLLVTGKTVDAANPANSRHEACGMCQP